jgi:hypothetical protein
LPNYIEFARGQKAKKSNSLKGKQPWAKSGIELGENGSIFPRPKGVLTALRHAGVELPDENTIRLVKRRR